MSGQAIMHDVKHIYHSIPMDTPGAITLRDRTPCCGGSKRIMTLILASALLWFIVLDIILVVYKSHHPHSHKLGATSRLMEGMFMRANPVNEVAFNETSNQQALLSSPPYPIIETDNNQTGGPVNQTNGSLETSNAFKREDQLILNGPPGVSSFQSWLAQLRHKSDSKFPKTFPELRSPLVTPRPEPHLPLPAPPRPRMPPLPGRNPNERRPFLPLPPLPFPPMSLLPPPEAMFPFRQRHGAMRQHWGPPQRPDVLPHPSEMHDGPRRPLPSAGRAADNKASEPALLLRFFSAIVDAPWNLTAPTSSKGDFGVPAPLLPPQALPPQTEFIGPFINDDDDEDEDDEEDHGDATIIDLDM